MRPRASISVVLVRPLVFALAKDAAALDAFYRATDLTPEMLADPEARVSPAQFCVAWSQAEELAKSPALALDLAESIPRGAFGVVEYVCRSSSSLGEALRHWVRYLGILDDAVDVALVEGAGDVALRVTRESEAPAPASHELCWALVAKNAADMVDGRFRARSVHFTHRPGARDVERYRAFFGCDVRFGAQHTELLIPKGAMEWRLTSADPQLLGILQKSADDAKKSQSTDPPLTDQVRRRLSSILEGADAQLESIAKQLGMTPRSLQRRLKDEGTSFQTLRDDTRSALARRYLGQGMSTAEISFLLGFSEPSAFFRAFKRWTGLTPIELRAKERAPA